MNDLNPRQPHRPLLWIDTIYDLQDSLANTKDPIYIVGGAVRDALMNRPIKDIDLATPGDSIKLARHIANSFPGSALYVMDEERGVARALIETLHGTINVDVAQFRGGIDDLLGDLQDRDFTINAMMVDLKGDLHQLIDPLLGERDIMTKIIRRCSPASIASDPIRALRAIRQSYQLTFRIEPETLKDVRTGSTLLANVSAERVRDEFFKILELPRPSAAMRVMDRINALDGVVPLREKSGDAEINHIFAVMDKLSPLVIGLLPVGTDNLAINFGLGLALVQLNRVRKNLETFIQQSWANDRSHRSLMMFMVLMRSFTINDLESYIDDLRLSNVEKKHVVTAIKSQNAIYDLPDTSPLSLHRYWYMLDAAGVDVALITLADYLARQGVMLEHQPWLQLVDRIQLVLEAYFLNYDTIVKPPVLVDGSVLMNQLDLKPGKVIGDLLNAIREAQVTGEVSTSEDAIRYAQAILDDEK